MIAQKLIEKKEHLKKTRSVVVSSFGCVESVVGGHFWLNYLEKIVGKQMTLKNAIYKTAFDMVIFCPIDICLFLLWTNHFDESHYTSLEKIKTDFPFVLANSYIYWVPATFCCFYFIPNKYRVLFVCLISVTWDTFMSFAAHNSIVEKFKEKFHITE